MKYNFKNRFKFSIFVKRNFLLLFFVLFYTINSFCENKTIESDQNQPIVNCTFKSNVGLGLTLLNKTFNFEIFANKEANVTIDNDVPETKSFEVTSTKNDDICTIKISKLEDLSDISLHFPSDITQPITATYHWTETINIEAKGTCENKNKNFPNDNYIEAFNRIYHDQLKPCYSTDNL